MNTKTLLLVAICFGLLLSGCSAAPCTRQDYLKGLGDIPTKWDDANVLAEQTGRIALSGPIAALQDIHQKTEALQVRSCYTHAQTHLLKYQEYTIDLYLRFMGNQSIIQAQENSANEFKDWESALKDLDDLNK